MCCFLNAWCLSTQKPPVSAKEGSCTRDWEGFGEVEEGSLLMISHVGMSAFSTATRLFHFGFILLTFSVWDILHSVNGYVLSIVWKYAMPDMPGGFGVLLVVAKRNMTSKKHICTWYQRNPGHFHNMSRWIVSPQSLDAWTLTAL